MKSIILVGALLLFSGMTYGQEKKVKMKLNPKKSTISLPKVKQTPASKPGTNGLTPAENSRKRPGRTVKPAPTSIERKRPGGTIQAAPKTSTQKTNGTKPKPVPTEKKK